MNLVEAEDLAIDLMSEYGLIDKGWTFYFDKAKRRFGLCHHGLKTISLSRYLVELNDRYHVRQTILHEIAHALVDSKHGHDAVWRQKAIEIGHSGSRTYSREVKRPEIIHKNKYSATCLNCKRKIYRYRKTFTLACGACCKKFNNNKWTDKYLFKWELVK